MSADAARTVAESAFNELRDLLIYSESDEPGRIARLLHLFDKSAIAEYT